MLLYSWRKIPLSSFVHGMLQGVLAIAEPIGKPLPPHGHRLYEQITVDRVKYNHQ
jgi:hypothetical protein